MTPGTPETPETSDSTAEAGASAATDTPDTADSKPVMPGNRLVLLMVALIGLVLAGSVLVTHHRNRAETVPVVTGPAETGPAATASAAQPVLVVDRHGDEVDLSGDVPDPTSAQTLLDLVTASLPDGVTIIDHVGIRPDVHIPDLDVAGPVFETAAAVPEFTLTVGEHTVTIGGTAQVARDRRAILAAAGQAWPDWTVVDRLRVSR